MNINWDAVWKIGVTGGGLLFGFHAKREREKAAQEIERASKEREKVAAAVKESNADTAKKLNTLNVMVDGGYTLALFGELQALKELYSYSQRQGDWLKVEAAQLVYDRHVAQQKVIQEREMERIRTAAQKPEEPKEP